MNVKELKKELEKYSDDADVQLGVYYDNCEHIQDLKDITNYKDEWITLRGDKTNYKEKYEVESQNHQELLDSIIDIAIELYPDHPDVREVMDKLQMEEVFDDVLEGLMYD